MRYMIILKNDPQSEQQVPTPEILAAMSNYNKALSDAGILRALEGLSNSEQDARTTFAKGKRKVIDGPFSEAKELVGGFWIIEVKSKGEALDWAQQIPAIEGVSIEVRRVAEADDFKGLMPPELVAQEEKIRQDLTRPRD